VNAVFRRYLGAHTAELSNSDRTKLQDRLVAVVIGESGNSKLGAQLRKTADGAYGVSGAGARFDLRQHRQHARCAATVDPMEGLRRE
jgi:hypothetical protein